MDIGSTPVAAFKPPQKLIHTRPLVTEALGFNGSNRNDHTNHEPRPPGNRLWTHRLLLRRPIRTSVLPRVSCTVDPLIPGPGRKDRRNT